LPRSYAATIAHAIRGRVETRIIAGAGHLAELDKPDEVAAAIVNFMV
jgi:pimeloyl-ACP methyl ester carboxylesterase